MWHLDVALHQISEPLSNISFRFTMIQFVQLKDLLIQPLGIP